MLEEKLKNLVDFKKLLIIINKKWMKNIKKLKIKTHFLQKNLLELIKEKCENLIKFY